MKNLRIQHGLTQSDIGKIVGVTKTEISRIERKVRNPSHEILIKLEQFFEQPHTYLFAEAGEE